MSDPSHVKGRSIGEVLEELRGDFPDVSVSKIRFLETQGLINPERTPSGYRQFSDDDVALLRWILVQQREHYLPLKVIRMRLRQGGWPRPGGAAAPEPERERGRDRKPAEPAPAAAPDATPPDVPPAAWYLEEDPGERAPLLAAEPAAPAAAPEPVLPAAEAPGPPAAPEAPAADLWAAPGPARTWSRDELGREAGLDEAALAQLESFGLIGAGGELDEAALEVARAAAGFSAYGVEARHLRMYKTFAEREATLFQQAVMPMVSPRHDESRARANEALAELARLGHTLRVAMLRAALGPPE